MPTYEYLCSVCGKKFEVMQKITEDALKECIHCGGSVKRLISPTAFHLKGGGWYKTDYASSSSSPPPSSGEKSSGESSGESSSTGGAKDSAAPEPAPAPKESGTKESKKE